MRIAFVIDGYMYPDVVGGAEIFTFRLAVELSRRKHEIHIIAWRGKEFRSMRINSNLFFHSINRHKPFSLIQCLAELKKIRPHIVIAVMGHSVPLAWIYSKLFCSPLVVRMAGIDVDMFFSPKLKATLKDRLYMLFVIKLMHSTGAYIVALSNNMFNKIAKLGINNNKIVLIPNFVDDDFFRLSPNVPGTNILFVGGLKHVKGVDILIEAMHKLVNKRNHRHIRLTIVGDGEEREKIKNIVNNYNLNSHVRLIGSVPYNLVKTYMNDASMLVLPSRSEGLPNVILQAMAAGLPIVATRVGGVPDLIKDGINGLLVPPEDPEELAKAIERLLVDRELAIMLGKNARIHAERYRVSRIVKSYEDFFRKIAQESCYG